MKKKCHKTLIVIVAGPTGVTGSRVIKFGSKEFPVKDQQAHSGQSERHKCFHKVA